MNQKKPYRSTEPRPVFLYDVEVSSGSKTYRITKGTLLSVHRKPGLLAGKYELLYAERSKDGTLLLTVEGPDSRIVSERRRKMIREADIKSVHLKSVRKP